MVVEDTEGMVVLVVEEKEVEERVLGVVEKEVEEKEKEIYHLLLHVHFLKM